MEKINRNGFLERELALDHYFQTLLFNGHQESGLREYKSSTAELLDTDLDALAIEILKHESSD